MKIISTLIVALTMAVTINAAELKVGDDAPDFKLKGSDGKTYQLSELKGKTAVVIAWFPKVFTGGCTAECKSLRDSSKDLQKFEVSYFTASTSTVEEAEKFAKSLELDYPILADTDSKVAEAYGTVTTLRRFPHRYTFYISKEGKILAIDKDVQTGTAGEDMAAKLAELKVAEKNTK